MHIAIAKIDRALKELYRLDCPHRAEHFLIKNPSVTIGNRSHGGAVYIRPDNNGLSLGIYLTRAVEDQLTGFLSWGKSKWSHDQLSAFSVATEEVSHFHYVLHHVPHRPISQLELELQGEVDRFVLCFFALRSLAINHEELFDALFASLFENFHLSPTLSPEQCARYEEANRLGKRVITKLRLQLIQASSLPKALDVLRQFYRWEMTAKVSFISR